MELNFCSSWPIRGNHKNCAPWKFAAIRHATTWSYSEKTNHIIQDEILAEIIIFRNMLRDWWNFDNGRSTFGRYSPSVINIRTELLVFGRFYIGGSAPNLSICQNRLPTNISSYTVWRISTTNLADQFEIEQRHLSISRLFSPSPRTHLSISLCPPFLGWMGTRAGIFPY